MSKETQTPNARASLTEEQLRACTGELEPSSSPVVIVAHDPQWSGHFQRESEQIRAVLGQQALRIEHVGSTSVPGLAAKPVIDILLVVTNSADECVYLPCLEAAGYMLRIRETNWHEHRMFKGPDTDINLHVFSLGCPEIDRMVMFREWLRRNEADHELYARAKLALATQDWKHVQNYADAKTAVIEEILLRARVAQ